MEPDIRARLKTQDYCGAFDLVVEQFKDKVFRLAYSMLDDPTQAEDVTQDIFVRIWKGLPGQRQAEALPSWVYTIARNTCLTELRRRAAHPTISLQTPEIELALERQPPLSTPDSEYGAAMDVQTLLAELPEKYRQVVVLFYLEQKAYEEVAAMLGLPLGTVKTYLFRAKKELLRIVSRRPVDALQAQG